MSWPHPQCRPEIGVVFRVHDTHGRVSPGFRRVRTQTPMRDDYLQAALHVIDDPMILVNVVSRRVKQLRQGSRPLVVSLEKLSAEDTALREISEGKISYELGLDAVHQ